MTPRRGPQHDDDTPTSPEAAAQWLQVVEAQAVAWAAQRVVEARVAGLPPASARRWPRYISLKEARGEQPITLAQAVEQKRDATRRAA